MDKRTFPSDKNTTRVKKKRLVITLEQNFDVTERHERGHSNSTIGRNVAIPESTVRNIIQHAGGIKERGKAASAFSRLQTPTRNRSVTMIEIECLLTVWIENCNQKLILSRTAIRTKALNLFKSVKETFNASVGWFDRF
jgi:hypothetical protein